MEADPKAPGFRHRGGIQRVVQALSNHALIVGLVLWVIAPVYTAVQGGGTLGGFIKSLFETSAFVPGFLGLIVAQHVSVLDWYGQLWHRIGEESSSIKKQVELLRQEAQHVASDSEDAHRFDNLYRQLTALGGDPEKAPIAEFAKEIFDQAQRDLSHLREHESYTLDVRAKTDRFSKDWIKAFSRVVRASNKQGTFKTVTNMVIWSEANLGFDKGGYSQYHEDQVRSSVDDNYKVQRVFVVPPTPLLEGGNVERAESYLRTLKLYRDKISASGSATAGSSHLPCYENRVFVSTSLQEYQSHFDTEAREPQYGSGNFALWSLDENHPLVANTVIYQGRRTDGLEDYPIESFTFTWSADVINKKYEEFQVKWGSPKTKQLDQYIGELEELVKKARTAG